MIHNSISDNLEWLLFFYSVPSRPVSNRVRVWRKLSKAGAVQLKGAVYMLPHNEEHYEFLQWLVTEIAVMGGEGAFVKVRQIETKGESELISLFNQQRGKDYSLIEKNLDELERKVVNAKNDGKGQSAKVLLEQLNKCSKEFEEVKRKDFFFAEGGAVFWSRLEAIEAEIRSLAGIELSIPVQSITPKRLDDYRGRTWFTRHRPFVDRMASAWLIKNFIDKDAIFKFISDEELAGLEEGAIAFDMRGGEFTHIGDMCTFEVLIKSFGLKGSVIKKMAEIVHELDVKDDKYKNSEAKGIEEILIGLRKTAGEDAEALKKGMAVFEMLYASKA